MVLHLHRSDRADRLADELATVLVNGPTDPFTPEVVAVPARGIERWLTQRLSHRLGSGSGDDGVAANISFPSPPRLIGAVTAAASGFGPDDDPWVQGIEWTLLDVIDRCRPEAWLLPLRRHLDADPGRRLAAARHLAELFRCYGEQRPQLFRDWQAGRETDGTGADLEADLGWQAELWRRLRATIGVASPAERLDDVCARVRDEPEVVDLPSRLSVFGPTRLTSAQVAVLGALAQHRDVHLWLPHPSAELWNHVEQAAPADRPRRDRDPTAALPHHPLLSSLGRDSREMQLLLTGTDESTAPASDVFHPGTDPVPGHPSTLLRRLQRALRDDEAPPGPPGGRGPDGRPALDHDDRSLTVHACHGRARQVEVLREVLLGLFDADATLEPRDVLVMCPDIESYAPLISATFGLGDVAGRDDQPPAHPGHRLRVGLADRSLRQTNPLLATVARLLELADSRVTASQVLDLAGSPPVRRRFRFDDEELERVRDWVGSAGVRWGIDADHRAPYQLDQVAQNTWRAGLDRVLVGVAMAEDELRWLGLALPLEDVDSRDIDLAGRVAELVDRLTGTLDSLGREQPLDGWLGALSEALDSLTAVGNAEAWQLAQAQRELTDVATDAGERSGYTRLGLADVRTALTDRLRGRPTRAGFRTGHLTMCSMVPMRSVPHRVICLLGLDDGTFPRAAGVDGDDILARDPLVGERDRRSEDRQLLLDALLAAEEHLVMLYSGADERTNTVRPPAVPLGEILDVVDATVRSPDDPSGTVRARTHVVVRHPLQPFDARNFVAGGLGTRGPFSFDTAALAGGVALTGARRATPGFLGQPLPSPAVSDTVELDRLHGFLEHPVRGFLRQRLGVAEPDAGDELDDALHAHLDGLATWAIGDQWLSQRLAGAPVEACRGAEWRRGRLPPGELGRTTLAEVEAAAEPLLAAASEHHIGDPTARDVSVPLPDGRLLVGTVGNLHRGTLLRAEYSRLGAKHRLRAWVLLLALAASDRGGEQSDLDRWRAVTIGRGRSVPRVARLTPPDRRTATRLLQALVTLREVGLCEPLPLPLGASLEYATMRRLGAGEHGARTRVGLDWPKGFESTDRDNVMVWGRPASFERVLDQRANDTDQPEGGAPESTRFGALACQLWFPLLDLESVGAA